MQANLAELITKANSYSGPWHMSELALEINYFLWARYDPDNGFIYPSIGSWDDLLVETIKTNAYSELTRDEVLSMLFGLHHRSRIIDCLWFSMFEQGVSQKLLGRLLLVDTN